MRARLLGWALLFIGCRYSELVPATKCGHECWTGPTKAVGIGACRAGIWRCDDHGMLEACEGQVLPSPEQCNAIDDDCNGLADEKVYRLCSSACGTGEEVCARGQFILCSAPQPQPEVCNGLDDDCNGQIDDLAVQYCYTGPVDTAQHGNCHPGTLRCVLGAPYCLGEVVPQPETCNGRDDNCNGLVDDGATSGVTDIVFIIDNSGSMGDKLAVLKAAVDGFADEFQSRSDLRWAVVTAPDPDSTYDMQVRLFSDFSDVTVFKAAIQQMLATGGGSEATLDALGELTEPGNVLKMSWYPNSKHLLLLFTDEEPQTYSSPYRQPADVAASILESGTGVYVFSVSPYYSLWGQYTSAGGGKVEPLVALEADLQTELRETVQAGSCH